jgi:hypothetical protein
MAPVLLIGILIAHDAFKFINARWNTKKIVKDHNNSSLLPWKILLPVIAYISLYSFLPHKELRFIFPSVAAFNICTAYALSQLWELRMQFRTSSKNRWVKRIAEVLALKQLVFL